MNTPAARGRAFSPGELAFLIGVPLLWALLLLFHPGGEGDQIYLDVQNDVTRFLVVHIGMMLFIPLMAFAVYLLLRGVEGTAARVSRIALVPYVVFYSAWETLQGTATAFSPTRSTDSRKRNGRQGRTSSKISPRALSLATLVSSPSSEPWD